MHSIQGCNTYINRRIKKKGLCIGRKIGSSMSTPETQRYQTLKRIRWPSKVPLMYNNEEGNSCDYDNYNNDNNLSGFEIVGETEHIEKIRKIFADSSARVSVVDNDNNGRVSKSSTSVSSKALGTQDNKRKVDGKLEGISYPSPFLRNHINTYGEKTLDDSLSSDSDHEILFHRRNLSETSWVAPEVQNRRDIIRVQNRIINLGDRSLITPTRLYIKEGEFTKVGSKSRVIFFLFDDILIIGKIETTRSFIHGVPTIVKFRKALDLRCLDVQIMPDNIKGNNLLVLKHYAAKNHLVNKWRRIYSAQNKVQRDEWFVDMCALREKLGKVSSPSVAAATRTLSSPRMLMY